MRIALTPNIKTILLHKKKNTFSDLYIYILVVEKEQFPQITCIGFESPHYCSTDECKHILTFQNFSGMNNTYIVNVEIF